MRLRHTIHGRFRYNIACSFGSGLIEAKIRYAVRFFPFNGTVRGTPSAEVYLKEYSKLVKENNVTGYKGVSPGVLLLLQPAEMHWPNCAHELSLVPYQDLRTLGKAEQVHQKS